jgi:NADPH:quinone reductase
VLITTEVDRPSPGPGQVLVEVAVSGVNFLDVYQRTGATPLQAPFIAGVEGVGVVTEVGASVSTLRAGQRVGWFSGGQGSFADAVVVAADRAVPLPDDVDHETAAAVLMQGVTAHDLATDTYPIQPGDPVVVHAAAGGVGQLLTQIARSAAVGSSEPCRRTRKPRSPGPPGLMRRCCTTTSPPRCEP